MSAPDFYTELTPKAMQMHKCCECHGEIRKGEVYHKLQGMWEGCWDSYKHCQSCWALIKTIQDRLQNEKRDAEDLLLTELGDFIMEEGVKSEVRLYMEIRKNRNAPESRGGWVEKESERILGKEGGV